MWIRPLGVLEAHVLAGTEGAIFPFWSRDSRALGFFTAGKLETIDLEARAPQIICDAPFARGGAWSPDGTIVFSPNTQTSLMRVGTNGKTRPRLLQSMYPSIRRIAGHGCFLTANTFCTWRFTTTHQRPGNNTIYYASLDGKENRPLFRSQTNAVYADGYVLFARSDQLMAQPFGSGSREIGGGASHSGAWGNE